MPPHSPVCVLVEIVIDDVEGAVTVEREGADRVELCADLGQGGTTPSIGMIRRVLASVECVGVQVMVRPRGGDFVYSEDEIAVMIEDARAIRELAAAATVPVGVVTGALTAEGAVDEQAMARIVQAARPVPVTFHKAIDAAKDLDAAYAALTRLGVERVLTSGGAPTALEGADALARLVAAPSGPAVLAGGGVRPHNIHELLAAVRVDEVHLRAQAPSERGDGTLRTDPQVVRDAVQAARSARLEM